MRAYTIHRFFVCEITGNAMAEISMSQNDELKCHLHTFKSKENALAYLEGEKRDWFLFCVENYVNHKKKIIEASGNTNQTITASLKLCDDALKVYFTKGVKTIAKSFVNGFKHFENILPSHNNPSYESSIHNLTELKKFCDTELKQA